MFFVPLVKCSFPYPKIRFNLIPILLTYRYVNADFGKIICLAIKKDENGLSKGFEFVNYDDLEDAKRAMEAINESELGNLFIGFVHRSTTTKYPL